MKKRDEQKSVISDTEIVDLYWQRDEKAIDETNKKYGKFLFSVAYSILHDRSDCEECQNDTYIGIWNAIPPARPASFPAFIAQIMRRTAINRYKEKSRKKRIPSELTTSIDDLSEILPAESSVNEEFGEKELGVLINEYVKALPTRPKYVFIERFFFASPVDSIAKDLSVSIHTVYREIDKIKQGLKEYLERNGVFI